MTPREEALAAVVFIVSDRVSDVLNQWLKSPETNRLERTAYEQMIGGLTAFVQMKADDASFTEEERAALRGPSMKENVARIRGKMAPPENALASVRAKIILRYELRELLVHPEGSERFQLNEAMLWELGMQIANYFSLEPAHARLSSGVVDTDLDGATLLLPGDDGQRQVHEDENPT